MTGIPTGDFWPSGKPKYHFVSLNPEDVIEARKANPRITQIPCGHCYGCRMDYARKWSDRMMMELEVCKKASFITLTYDDLNVPISILDDEEDFLINGYTLRKDHAQKFIKRLRKYFEYHNGKNFRYYLCGEYGESTHRPHYHAILFGLDPTEDLECEDVIGQNGLGQPYFKSPVLDKVWDKGYTLACEVSYETCNYVARYVTKKVNSKFDPEQYGLEKEFALMSRRPGIGSDWIKLHPNWKEFDQIQLPEGRKAQIPRFMVDKYLTEDEKMVRYAHKVFLAENGTKHHMESSCLSVLDSLAASEEVRMQKAKILSRSSV